MSCPDVIVVGAGPVGLITALGFARAGVPVTVLETQTSGVTPEWRGSTMHPPTLEYLAELGLAEPVVAGAVRVSRVQFRDLEHDAVVTFDYGALAGLTPFPCRLQFEQYKLLRLLRARAEASPLVELRYDRQVVALSADGDGAVVTAESAAGRRERERARWVVGADGARSAVRKLTGIGFPGDTYPGQSLVAATAFPFENAIDDLAAVCYWTGPDGRLSLIRTPDVWRMAVSVPDDPGAAPPEGTYGTEHPHPALTAALARLPGTAASAGQQLEQHQFYRSHQRVAGSFRAGRALLAGDAAHLTSTTGGMGLNSGVHDAFDLVARLAPPLAAGDQAAQDRAADGYAQTRRAVAIETVQPETRSLRAAADATDRARRLQRLDALRELAADPARQQSHLWQLSMFDAARAGRDGRPVTVRAAS